jgi:hypothetical protein
VGGKGQDLTSVSSSCQRQKKILCLHQHLLLICGRDKLTRRFLVPRYYLIEEIVEDFYQLV